MLTVVFEGNLFGPTRRVDAVGGEKLVDLCDGSLAAVPFSCRSATCGTCRIEIAEGSDLLEPPQGEEAVLLAILEDGPHVRLACQARVRHVDAEGGSQAALAGVIRIRLAGEEI